MKFLSILLIAFLFIQAFMEAKSVSGARESLSQEVTGGNLEGLLKKHHPRMINCRNECKRRCSKASRKKICHRACKSCCAKCHCVPPGTSGNKNLCPCYANLKTHGNKPKCP